VAIFLAVDLLIFAYEYWSVQQAGGALPSLQQAGAARGSTRAEGGRARQAARVQNARRRRVAPAAERRGVEDCLLCAAHSPRHARGTGAPRIWCKLSLPRDCVEGSFEWLGFSVGGSQPTPLAACLRM
jgi:hypothetical protein